MAAVDTRKGWITFSAAGDASDMKCAWNQLIWSGYTDATHTLAVKDGDGTVLFTLTAGVATGTPIVIKMYEQIIENLEVDVLGSGTVVGRYA